MTIDNDFLILDGDINVIFGDTFDGLTVGIDDMKGMDNGYSIIRFRKENPGRIEDEANLISYFKPSGDFEIYAVGVSVQLTEIPGGDTTATTDVKYRVIISGATSDLQSDAPVVDHLWLGEPITNVDRDYIECPLDTGDSSAASTRYVGYKLDNNRICNTLLRGSKYEINMFTDVPPPGTYGVMVDAFIVYKPSLRRN